MTLHPATVLQRVSKLSLRLDSDNNARVFVDDRIIECGPYAMIVFQVFAHPITVSDAFSKLQTWGKNPQEIIDLTGTVFQLYQAGLLVDESSVTTQLLSDANAFDSSVVHISLLNDRERTQAFIKAIEETVRPTDVVLDLGTGSGVLAIAAAKAGAKHVYAIEAGGTGKAARLMFEANNVADRITLLQGWSTQLESPELADVLITETVGNDPLGERILEVTLDAVQRLLRPTARVIPAKLRICAVAATILAEELEVRTFVPETIAKWQRWYGIDFRTLANTTGKTQNVFYVPPATARRWSLLSDGLTLAEIDLKENRGLVIDTTVEGVINRAGCFNGLVVYFELDLSPASKMSMHPASASDDSCWSLPVLLLQEPVFAPEQQHFEVSFRYRAGQTVEGLTVVIN